MTDVDEQQRIINVLAHCDSALLDQHFSALAPVNGWHFIRKPESGLVMVRGRMGGSGGQFNLGEVTVTRAVIALETGETGYSYALGRDARKAEQAALVHALWKRADMREAVETRIIAPLEKDLDEAKQRQREEVAPTKVDFFTLMRGED